MSVSDWKCALQLDKERNLIAGSEQELANAIRNGADLRVYTEFRHNEHVDPSSDNPELVHEVAEFGLTYLIDDSWTAGAMSERQPVSLPDAFGGRASMSFFLYNQNGQQAIARPYLDGGSSGGEIGLSPAPDYSDMALMHGQDHYDEGTNAPSNNFIYDFETYRFNVCDNWQQVLAHDDSGKVISGSVDDLGEAFSSGCHVKVAVRGCLSPLADGTALDNELFVRVHSCYYYTEEKLFVGASVPVVRIAPAQPMLYRSRGWDFGWLLLRTDGFAAYRRCDPYTLAFEDSETSLGVRWFVR